MGPERLRVPVGRDSTRWRTREGLRTVLFIVHNVTSATRLLDVLPLFDDAPDVLCLATCTGSSPFQAGVPELLDGAGLPVVPWEQARELATEGRIDLAVTASYGGELHFFEGKLTILSHGVGYNKRLPTPDTGGGAREPSAAAPVFGTAPEWVLHEGRPLATATVLSHPEQLERLRRDCPEAAATAVLAGDPCFDRMLALRHRRPALRRAFGVGDGRRLVVLNSTWGRASLAGSDAFPALLRESAETLPADEYRLCAVLHPNIWYGHGPGQVRRWLRRAEDSGLTPIDPLGPWRQAVAAADCVLGDHGSVTYYAAALGLPVLLGAFAHEDLDPASPVAELGRTAPALRPGVPLRAQLDAVIEGHVPGRYDGFAATASSDPGGSARLLRTLFHSLLRLPEPARPARLDPLPVPEGLGPPAVTVPVRVLTSVRPTGPDGLPEITVTRHADPAAEPDAPDADAAHTAVDEATADTGQLALADVIVDRLRNGDPAGPRAAELLRQYPYAGLVAVRTGPGSCLVRAREDTAEGAGDASLELTALPRPDGFADPCDPAAYASAVHAWRTGGRPLTALAAAGTLVVVTGAVRHRVGVRAVGARAGAEGPGPG
ncbi:hypothetical protein VO63_08990 [Streptomyces showdoensis]|uniref:Translation initiation factor 2 n=1 Tax=Streptomyces showdoensis TaxID=68268 RepID=A0A2P2GS17_STREW|nr:hypothetical protein [Streptomyces showdoensis]KKZ74296.1 hypothetical protein VO63_08990 [Streptomyces showdoensis]